VNLEVIWHDLECGGYEQDLPLWRELAAAHAPAPDGRVLDIGAGTGRVALALARAGHHVVALDLDADLLAALSERADAQALNVATLHGDARDLELELDGERFALCAVPMQTIQLFGGDAARGDFIRAAAGQLSEHGVLAIAIAAAKDFEEFQWHDGDPFPLPDIVERDGVIYCSQPTAVRREGAGFVLERRREVIDAAGERTQSQNVIALDTVTAAAIEEAGQRAGLKPLGVRLVAATAEHIGSEVVLLGR
jgi:SAM-dependent methyltransferase